MNVHYVVELTRKERQELESFVASGTTMVRKLKRAQVLLAADSGVKDVDIDIVWEPYWTPDRIDPKIRAMMGF